MTPEQLEQAATITAAAVGIYSTGVKDAVTKCRILQCGTNTVTASGSGAVQSNNVVS